MNIREIMTPNPEFISSDSTIKEAAQKMKSLEIGFLPVGTNNKLDGIVTDRDIITRCIAEGKDPNVTKVEHAMSTNIKQISADEQIEMAGKMMEESQIRRLIVVDNQQKPIGVLSLGDLSIDNKKLAGEALRDISTPSKPNR